MSASTSAAWLVAGRCLLGRRLPGEGLHGRRYMAGAVLGVALSLVPLLVVLVVADGMIQGITARYLETATYHIRAMPLVPMDASRLREKAAELSRLPGIVAALPEIQGPAVALAGGRDAGVLIRAVEPSFFQDPGVAKYLEQVEGSATISAGNQIVLGEAVAKSMNLHPGDIVSLMTAKSTQTANNFFSGSGEAFRPRVTPLKVSGIVSAGYRELDSLWVFIDLKTASRILGTESSRPMVGLKVEAPLANNAKLIASIRGGLDSDWIVYPWQEAERNLWHLLSTTKALLLLIMAVAVVVAAVNVGSALVMLVLERRRDIAVLKSAGASDGFIASVFTLAGLATGGLGTLLGLAAGSLLAWRINDILRLIERGVNLISAAVSLLSGRPRLAAFRILDPAYYLETIPVRIDPGSLAIVAVASLGLCFLVSLVPARRAARLSPLEVLRKT